MLTVPAPSPACWAVPASGQPAPPPAAFPHRYHLGMQRCVLSLGSQALLAWRWGRVTAPPPCGQPRESSPNSPGARTATAFHPQTVLPSELRLLALCQLASEIETSAVFRELLTVHVLTMSTLRRNLTLITSGRHTKRP